MISHTNDFSDLEKLKEFSVEYWQSVICNFTHDWVTKVKCLQTHLANKNLNDIEIATRYSQTLKREPTVADEKREKKPLRKSLIRSMISDIKSSAFDFGHGNCQIMAELAFLCAIQQLSYTPIFYIRFEHSKGKYEELNAIAVGPWPDRCTILAPWYSEKSFEWKGNFEHTPELDHYDQYHVLFSINNSAEQQEWQQFLIEEKFNIETLLNSPNRKNYFSYIKDTSQKVFSLVHPQGNTNQYKQTT